MAKDFAHSRKLEFKLDHYLRTTVTQDPLAEASAEENKSRKTG